MKKSEMNPGQFSRQAINDRVLQEVSTLRHLSVSGETGHAYLKRTTQETPDNEPTIRGIKPRAITEETLRVLSRRYPEIVRDALNRRLIEVV